MQEMAMADECCDASKIVTTFLLNTCRLPSWSQQDLEAAMWYAHTAGKQAYDDDEAEFIPLITGSVAEFYIEPMLPYVGDIDVMHHSNNQLTIPRGHPPPTQLPAEFHAYVNLNEIIDSHLPGYVYLQLHYLLAKCADDGKYNHFDCDERGYLSNRVYRYALDVRQRHGPARFTDNSYSSYLSVDSVTCVRCLSWPTQAADWPTRHRNYGWPDSATLYRVVSNGCDVVPVAHRQCRQHEWMGERQWRLSFSRAEIVLINSWMPLQQIVYHLLRHFIKTERLTDCADNSEAGTLSNYHIKTLMLWACELKSGSWWTENLSLVRICVELLHTLSVWLTDTRCPHYFINNCNLLDNYFNVGSSASKLASIDEEYLSTWLINNYMGECVKRCPLYISLLFNDVNSTIKLKNVVSEIIGWRLGNSLYDMWKTVDFAEHTIATHLPRSSRSCIYWLIELEKIDRRFLVYFSAVQLLHVARKISRNNFNDNLLDILAITLGSNVNQCRSALSLHNTEQNATQLVELVQKSAVEYLTRYRQLMAPEFSSVATIVTTDFEAMYAYKRGDYQRCLQLSTQNVYTMLFGRRVIHVLTYPEFIQLLDDDIVSLTALTVIINPECRFLNRNVTISQLTLLLHLMAQCQLKLHHSVTSLSQTLQYIKDAQRLQSRDHPLNQLTLKLIERKVYLMILH